MDFCAIFQKETKIAHRQEKRQDDGKMSEHSHQQRS